MDLNLGNLGVLKRFVLPESQWLADRFDASLSLIGLGVASRFDRYCNRKFKRSSAHVDTFAADRSHWYLAAAPVESITSIETKSDQSSGYSSWGSVVIVHEASGNLDFGSQAGSEQSIIRVTYAGGYWYDATDNQDDTIPAGAAALPQDIRLAWLLQCQHTFALRDQSGNVVGLEVGKGTKLQDLELIPEVKMVLDGHIRYQMT